MMIASSTQMTMAAKLGETVADNQEEIALTSKRCALPLILIALGIVDIGYLVVLRCVVS